MNDIKNKILQGDCLTILKTLPDECIDCCVTSPPYFNLRDYGTATWAGGDVNCEHVAEVISKRETGQSGATGRGSDTTTILVSEKLGDCQKCGAKRVDSQIGLEKTPEEFVAKLVEVFREVRRVLKKEGTVFLNLGDSYASGKGTCYNPGGGENSLGQDRKEQCVHPIDRGNKSTLSAIGLKPKDLIGIPWMTAFALRTDGWYLRQDIIWDKKNPMPESVIDRCTKSHEYIFLLTKSANYYFDYIAIQEEATGYDGRKDIFLKGSQKYANGFVPGQSAQSCAVRGHERWQRKNDDTNYGGNGTGFQDHSGYSNLDNPYVRNKRSVWHIATKSYKGSHFATFPEALIIPMIKAGASEKGVCPDCGKAFERIIESYRYATRPGTDTKITGDPMTDGNRDKERHETQIKTVGWQPQCQCGKEPVPAIVLDPFGGAMTTAMVALKLNRNFVAIELNKEYCIMGKERIENDVETLFNAPVDII